LEGRNNEETNGYGRQLLGAEAHVRRIERHALLVRQAELRRSY
jgi:hypothetical protein